MKVLITALINYPFNCSCGQWLMVISDSDASSCEAWRERVVFHSIFQKNKGRRVTNIFNISSFWLSKLIKHFNFWSMNEVKQGRHVVQEYIIIILFHTGCWHLLWSWNSDWTSTLTIDQSNLSIFNINLWSIM